MGGTNSKTNKNKLDEIKDTVNEIADDIIKNKGIGVYQFADGSKEKYRSLTDSSKCKKYAIVFAETMKEDFDEFTIYNKDKELGDVTLIPFEGDHNTHKDGTENDGSMVFKGIHLKKEQVCYEIANYYVLFLNAIVSIVNILSDCKFCQQRLGSLFTPNQSDSKLGHTKICISNQLHVDNKTSLNNLHNIDTITRLYHPKRLLINSEENRRIQSQKMSNFLNTVYRLFPVWYPDNVLQDKTYNWIKKGGAKKSKKKFKKVGGWDPEKGPIPIPGKITVNDIKQHTTFDIEKNLFENEYNRFLKQIADIDTKYYNPAKLNSCTEGKYKNIEINLEDPVFKHFNEKYEEFKKSYTADLTKLFDILKNKLTRYSTNSEKYKINDNLSHKDLQAIIFEIQDIMLTLIKNCEEKYREALRPLFKALCSKNFLKDSTTLMGPYGVASPK